MPPGEGTQQRDVYQLPLHARVQMREDADLTKAALTAEEGFVLSRVDGQTDVESLCLISGLGDATTIRILWRLRAKGLIQVGDEPVPETPTQEPRRTRKSSETPAREEPRRSRRSSETPAREARRARKSSETPAREEPRRTMKSEAAARETAAREEQPRSRRASPPIQAQDTVVDGAPLSEIDTDTEGMPAIPELIEVPEVEEGIDLKLEIRKDIRALHAKLGDLNCFELLDLPPYSNPKEVRRAYFKKSKKFHPDRHFGKKLGPYQEMLQEIFKQMKAAYTFLKDEGQGKAYSEMVAQEMDEAQAIRQVEQQAERALKEDLKVEDDSSHASLEEQQKAADEVHAKSRQRKKSLRAYSARQALVKMTGAAKGANKPMPPRAMHRPESEDRLQRRHDDRKRRATRLTGNLFSRAKRATQFFAQGMAQLEKGQFLAATASLKLAVAYNPDDQEYKLRYEEAIEKSREVTAESYFKRAIMEESVGRYDAAALNYIKAAESHDKPVYLCRAAEACLWSNELIKAKEYATKAVQTEPNTVENRIALAKAFKAAKMGKNAKRELQEALKLDPNNSEAKKLLKEVR